MFKDAGDIISLAPPVLAAPEAVEFIKDIGSAKWPRSGALVGARYDAEIQGWERQPSYKQISKVKMGRAWMEGKGLRYELVMALSLAADLH